MSKHNNYVTPRRTFIFSISSFLAGSQFLLPSISREAKKKSLDLKERLSPEELKWIEKSKMAKDLMNYYGKGYHCAESILMVALRYLKMPENLDWSSVGFGAGFFQKDLCGFLTGGVMAIGFAAGTLKMNRKTARKYCIDATKKYWKWWETMAPRHCCEIRKPGSKREICIRLGQMASTKVEELIKVIATSF